VEAGARVSVVWAVLENSIRLVLWPWKEQGAEAWVSRWVVFVRLVFGCMGPSWCFSEVRSYAYLAYSGTCSPRCLSVPLLWFVVLQL
jgi:hypothetical protein